MNKMHPDDLTDYACQLQESAKDIEEYIEADDLPKARKCVAQASILLSRLMTGIFDLHLQRRKK